MADIPGTTRAQTKFLRALRNDGSGLVSDHWPNAMMLRRWLRRHGFRKAMEELREAMLYQADMHLASAAATGAKCIATSLRWAEDGNSIPPAEMHKQMSIVIQMMRGEESRRKNSDAALRTSTRSARQILEEMESLESELNLVRKADQIVESHTAKLRAEMEIERLRKRQFARRSWLQ